MSGMTALKEFERLESLGLWKEGDHAQRREVIVSFGDSTLVISDKNENALSHWSLAAVRRVSKGRVTRYSPDDNDEENIEIDDDIMIAAIERIRTSLRRGKPRTGLLRWTLTGIIVACIAGLALFWLPNALINYAARVLPDAKVAELGAMTLRNVHGLTGSPCETPEGRHSLTQLHDRLIGTDNGKIYIVDIGARNSAHLPGNIILINRQLVEDYTGPEIAAGFVLMEKANAEFKPARISFFETAGTMNTMRFLLTGEIRAASIDAFVAAQVTRDQVAAPSPELLSLFELANMSSKPFATVTRLPDDHPLVTDGPISERTTPLMADQDWLALQSICDG
jgi:hypothetical protein